MPAREPPIDSRIEIVTPENIAFQYRVAGPFRRLMAYFIDVGLRAVVWIGILFGAALAFSTVGMAELVVAVGRISWFLLAWFYGGLFEAFWNGQTPGKRVMQIRVMTSDGQPISGLQAVLRNFLRGVDGFPLVQLSVGEITFLLPMYMLGFATAACNRRFQRLGDLFSHTMVVCEERERLGDLPQVNAPETIALAAQLPADLGENPNLAKALIAYVTRRRRFGINRRDEMARHLAEPLARRFDLPTTPPADLLLCAVYRKMCIEDVGTGEPIFEAVPVEEPTDELPVIVP